MAQLSIPQAFDLAVRQQQAGNLQVAESLYRQVLKVVPNHAGAYYNLASALYAQGHLDEAIVACRETLRLKPDFVTAYCHLGNALREQGSLDEAIAAYRTALRLKPDDAEAHSALLFCLHYHPALDAVAIAQAHREWNARHAQPLGRNIPPHSNIPDPGRRLRVGYVSPDFRGHAQSFFTIPLFSNHDRDQFEVVCYAGVVAPDAITGRIQGLVDRWRSTVGMSDSQLADQIREDQIDILVDLTLHMPGHRLLTFARKPAPIQVTWLGYPGTTGLDTIDHRLSDPYLDPLEQDGGTLYSEQTVRLPATFWCYDPLEAGQLPVGPLPATKNGFVTFGCLNTFCKINESVLQSWAKVLRAVEGSRLLLLTPEGRARGWTLETLAWEGVAAERVEFASRLPRRRYLQLYNRIDIGLDSFPYNGHTTSLDSFWMGVPVVSWVGPTIVGRAGWSLLSNLNLQELAGNTPEEFVQIGVALAHDLPHLAQLRATLRQRMQGSSLMDAPAFARGIEAAYRRMWQAWCVRR